MDSHSGNWLYISSPMGGGGNLIRMNVSDPTAIGSATILSSSFTGGIAVNSVTGRYATANGFGDQLRVFNQDTTIYDTESITQTVSSNNMVYLDSASETGFSAGEGVLLGIADVPGFADTPDGGTFANFFSTSRNLAGSYGQVDLGIETGTNQVQFRLLAADFDDNEIATPATLTPFEFSWTICFLQPFPSPVPRHWRCY